MDLLTEPVWRRFWYPVGFAEDLAATPVARTVLGEPIVLWRTGEDSVAAAVDRCPHRDAPLSAGWLCEDRIVCPYHGWQYGAGGGAALIPQTPELTSFPPRFALTPVRTMVCYGVIWVCLGDPILALPELSDAEELGWRWIKEFDEEWEAHAGQLMENSLDPAHTMFVHRATFGDAQGADIETPIVERTSYGLRMTSDFSVKNPDSSHRTTGETTVKTQRSTVTELHGPFLRIFKITYPSGRHHQIVTAATPVDNHRLRLVQWVLRDDTEEECPASEAVAFDRRVTLEDRTLLEAIRVPYTPDIEANVHIRVDRPTVTLRHIYQDIMAGAWPGPLPLERVEGPDRLPEGVPA